jgi:tetratricopeptide (TPR) repeat protein
MSVEEVKLRIDNFKKAGDGKGEAEASVEAARLYLSSGSTIEALALAKAARVLSREAKEAKTEVEAVQVISLILATNGDVEEATREAYDALNIAKKLGDAQTTASATLNAVNIHYQSVAKENPDSDLFKEGVKELRGTAEDAAKAFKKLKDSPGHAAALLALARVYMLIDEPDKAKFAADMAYMLFNQAKDGNGFYEACICLSQAHIQRSDFASAMRYCNEAGAVCLEFQDLMGMAAIDELSEQIKDCTRLRHEQLAQKVYNCMTMQKLAFT